MYGKWFSELADGNQISILNSIHSKCWHSRDGSFIDKFNSNFEFEPNSIVNSLNSFSDHSAISCTLPLNQSNPSLFIPTVRPFNKANIPKLNGYILGKIQSECIPVDANLTNDECKRVALSINKIFTNSIDRFVPKTNIKHRIFLSSGTRANPSLKLSKEKSNEWARLPPDTFVNHESISINCLGV